MLIVRLSDAPTGQAIRLAHSRRCAGQAMRLPSLTSGAASRFQRAALAVLLLLLLMGLPCSSLLSAVWLCCTLLCSARFMHMPAGAGEAVTV